MPWNELAPLLLLPSLLFPLRLRLLPPFNTHLARPYLQLLSLSSIHRMAFSSDLPGSSTSTQTAQRYDPPSSDSKPSPFRRFFHLRRYRRSRWFTPVLLFMILICIVAIILAAVFSYASSVSPFVLCHLSISRSQQRPRLAFSLNLPLTSLLLLGRTSFFLADRQTKR